MMSEILFSANAIESLKEALSCAFWYKRDLISFLSNCIENKL